MPMLARKFEVGYTQAETRAAIVGMCTQLWGPYTGRQENPNRMLGFSNLEWPDFHGAKHVWANTSMFSFAPFLASSWDETNQVHKNPSGAGTCATTVSNTGVPLYVMVFAEANYLAYSVVTADVTYRYAIGKFQGVPPWWGASNRVYITEDHVNVLTVPGMNPYGALDAQGNASPLGRTSFSTDALGRNYRPNLLTEKRNLRINDHLVDGPYGIMGYYPKEFGVGATFGISDDQPVLFDGGVGRLYVSLNGLGSVEWCVHVEEPPFLNMPTYEADFFDLLAPEGYDPGGNGSGGEPEECVEVWPSYGQTFPNPRALNMSSQSEPEP